MSNSPRIIAVLLTYRRQHRLHETLQAILRQTQLVDQLYVVDNESSWQTRRIVEEAGVEFPHVPIEYAQTPENLGSAGGWALGMRDVLADAEDEDWVLPLDDDNPPMEDDEIERMYLFANTQRRHRPKVAAVGIVGARVDWRTGRIRRLADDQLEKAAPVDFVGTGNIPFYSVAALRKVGVFDKNLFFGFTELELGLRLRRAGFDILANGELWRRRRRASGKLNLTVKPSKLCRIHWKKYYVIRNYIHIMKQYRRVDLVLKYATIQCLAKPLYTAFRRPRSAWVGFRLASRAVFDGLTGKLGRRVEPVLEPSQPSTSSPRYEPVEMV